MEIKHPAQLLSDLTGAESDSTSLVALRDMLDVADDLEAHGTPLARLFAGALAGLGSMESGQ